MNIVISEDAVNWYAQELDINPKSSLRFFVRYGGIGGLIPGFSLGINIEEPKIIHTSVTKNDIQFFIEEEDAWYFENKDLVITFNENIGEPQFTYE